MKKKLLTPPPENNALLVIPSYEEMKDVLRRCRRVMVAHQPYFFNPGVSTKFIFIDEISAHRDIKTIFVFVDTDRINLIVDVPQERGVGKMEFIKSEEVLINYSSPARQVWEEKFRELDEYLGNFHCPDEVRENAIQFRDIITAFSRPLLKEALSDAFCEFYGFRRNYEFVSTYINSEEYKSFVKFIYENSDDFRRCFNEVLVDYRRTFRFRYKSFPFPPLEKDELPFWYIEDNRRLRLFKYMVSPSDIGDIYVVPRASTLTLFLRMYKCDCFIHGVGGANYEWVNDRLIERFFKKDAAPYFVVSGTFLLNSYAHRNFPYFFFEPYRIRRRVKDYLLQ